MSDTGCFLCIHHPVCKHFDIWREHFPFKDDLYIKGFLKEISDTLSKACAYFEERKDRNKKCQQ